jgi:Leucine-rich repeat (LRR) protein
LKVLDCRSNAITELPPLPPTLEVLYCMSNAITSLPPLPPALKVLSCDYESMIYPPPDIIQKPIKYIREWMNENPPVYIKSAYKV